MKCSNCHNISEKNEVCIICGDTFCSYICMEPHMLLSHKKNMNIPIEYNYTDQSSKNSKNYLLNLNNNQYNIKSPYLIPGVLNIEQKIFDEKYNLDNFVPIFEDGEPKIIGCGSFGEVFLVMNTINKKLYAIKHMEKKSLSTKLNSLEGIYKEIYIQSRIDHPNILPILYVNETSSDFDLVLEYASGGSLFHYIRRKKYLTEPLAFSLFIQVINAIYFLHKNNFIHRDIKPENILLFDNNVVKICDFGWCVRLEEGQQRATFCGTTEYMSPELVNHEVYSKEIDVWSLGVLLYEMVHGYSPFRPDKPNFNAKDVIENIRLHKLRFNKNISQECKELIYHLLDEDPNKRYKVEDIFHSDFVKFYEEKNYGFPDNYLIEKYKFKLAKSSYSKVKNNSTKAYFNNSLNIDNNFINLNKFIIRKNSEIIVNNFKKDKNLGLIYDKNNKRNILYKKEIIPSSLSDTNLKTNKMCEKKLTKNKTTQYFHPLKSYEGKNNYLYLGISKSKNNSNQRLITQFNSNEQKENEDNNLQKLISKKDKKIKKITINNCFSNLNPNGINLIKKSEEKKNINEKLESNIVQKKNLHIKPLKMSKIPINTKIFHYVHSPINRENTNYLLIKKYLSPKNMVNIKNNKITSFQSNKSIESKYIEVKRNKFLNTPINNNNSNNIQNKKLNNNNYSKKTYTRNHISNEHYNTTKINYNSDENISNINTNNNSHNNDCFTFNAISNLNNDDLVLDRIKQRKLSCTKSLNHLKRNFNNDNIKSLFISNIKNNINSLNNNSINSEKNYLSSKNKVYINKKAKCNLNIDINEKKISTNTFHTYQNSPLNTFNNNFIYINFNNENKESNYLKKDNNLNICTCTSNNSYNINYSNNSKNRINRKDFILNNNKYYDNLPEISKKKFHKSNLSAKINNFEEYTKYKIIDKILNHNENSKTNMNYLELSNENYYYDNSSRLLNSMSHNSIFNNNKNNKIRNQKKLIFHNIIEDDKKIKKIPKTKTFKKVQSLNNNFNNKQKIEIFDKNKYNNRNTKNYNQHKIFSLETEKIKNRNNLNYNRDRNHKADANQSKPRNNSNRSNNSNDIKFKIIKRLELNDFLNNKVNKDKKNAITSLNEMNFNTSGNQSDTVKMNRVNTSINNKYCCEFFESSKTNPKYSFGSRNFYIIGKRHQIQNQIKSKNSNIIKQNSIKEQKSNNLENKIKIIIKKEPKTIISPIIPKHKKEINIFIKSENNINFENVEHKSKNKLKNNIIGNKVYSNELFLDKNDYKKYIFSGSSSVRNFKNNNF